MSLILAIESSCDDMSAAVIQHHDILSNVVASQIQHEQFGGVVPEVASRQHLIDVLPVVEAALLQADKKYSDLNAIAVTQGPGLMGSLLVGVNFAKALALALHIPLIAVHHMHAHILSHFAEDPKPDFPFLCLTVSGGHTQLVVVNRHDDMKVLGKTLDDAAGEAFDKTGKLLGLPYPAGPVMDKLAKEGKVRFHFGEPAIAGFDYSFSGFKTSVLYFLKEQLREDNHFIQNNLHDICASIQSSIVHILLRKLKKAVEHTGIKTVAIAGGVAANSELRKQLFQIAEEKHWKVFVPAMQYCTDNAGMIAVAAKFKYDHHQFEDQGLTPNPRLPF